MRSLPDGAVIEVGNPNFSQNLNLMYGISHVENYDALGVGTYMYLYNLLLPLQNNWKKTDQVSIGKFHELGVSYIVSDFDINAKRTILNSESNIVFPPLTKQNIYTISFSATATHLQGIRFLGANFNKYNTCTIHISFFKKDVQNALFQKNLACSSIRDKMFYYVPLNIQTTPHNQYFFQINSPDASQNNAVALVGGSLPYFEIFYESDAHQQKFPLLFEYGSVYLWRVPGHKPVYVNGMYRILSQSTSQSTVLVITNKYGFLTIERVKYPGWQVSVDGIPQKLENNVFLQVAISKGTHIIKFTYVPYSVIGGFIISLTVLIIILLYEIRRQRVTINKSLRSLRSASQSISLSQYILIFICSFIFSSGIYILYMYFFHPHFVLSNSGTINWYSVYGYPKQQDYFYFYTAFPFITGMTILSTIIIIWKRIKS